MKQARPRRSALLWALLATLAAVGSGAVLVLPSDGVAELSEGSQPAHGIQLYGRVVDESSAPVEGAEIWHGDRLLARTDEDGWVRTAIARELVGPPPRTISITAPGRQVIGGQNLQFGKVSLPALIPLRGLVVDVAGEPIPGAEVLYRYKDEDPGHEPSRRTGYTVQRIMKPRPRALTTTDADGRFELLDRPAGGGFAVAHAPGYFHEWVELGRFHERESYLVFELDRDPAREPRRVHVLDPDGEEIRQVQIFWMDGDRLESAVGASPLRVSRRFGELVWIEVRDRRERFLPLRLDEVPPGDEPLRLQLEPREAPIQLVVHDAGGRPVLGASVHLTWELHPHRPAWIGGDLGVTGRTEVQRPEVPFQVVVAVPHAPVQSFGPFAPSGIGAELVIRLDPIELHPGREKPKSEQQLEQHPVLPSQFTRFPGWSAAEELFVVVEDPHRRVMNTLPFARLHARSGPMRSVEVDLVGGGSDWTDVVLGYERLARTVERQPWLTAWQARVAGRLTAARITVSLGPAGELTVKAADLEAWREVGLEARPLTALSFEGHSRRRKDHDLYGSGVLGEDGTLLITYSTGWPGPMGAKLGIEVRVEDGLFGLIYPDGTIELRERD